MSVRYFVIANGGGGHPLPITNDDDEIALYRTKREAIDMAEHQPLCSARGYEVIAWHYLDSAPADAGKGDDHD